MLEVGIMGHRMPEHAGYNCGDPGQVMQRSIDVGVLGAVRPAEWLVRGGTIVERAGFQK